jgi:tRNA(adenine34) deaminase
MNLEIFPHEHFMRLAFDQAVPASELDEVPVGALIVHGQRIIGSAHNLCQQLRDPTAHAEMLAITQAAESIGDWRLENCVMYVTLEPCPMCAGAILQARIPMVVYGAADPKGGAVASLYEMLSDSRMNHQAEVTSGVLSNQCGMILTDFFQNKRKLGKK